MVRKTAKTKNEVKKEYEADERINYALKNISTGIGFLLNPLLPSLPSLLTSLVLHPDVLDEEEAVLPRRLTPEVRAGELVGGG